jgi:hypothetical protein
MSTYTKTAVPLSLSDVCTPPENYYTNTDLLAMFPDGIASDDLVPDPATGRIPVARLQSKVQTLTNSGIIPARPTVKIDNTVSETDMNKLVPQDAGLFTKFRNEYCYYEQRYRYALKQFLALATSRNQGDDNKATEMLQITRTLNVRTNSVLEIMNYLAQDRVVQVNTNKLQIDKFNDSITKKLVNLNNQYAYLNKENVIVNTQKASVSYAEEKNTYTTNQISIWAALNVVALATIFYVYRS